MMENHEGTRAAEAVFWSMDYDYSYLPGQDYIESLDDVRTFVEYTYKYAQKKGFQGEQTDVNALAKFIYNLGIEAQSSLSSLETVKNWIKKSKVANTDEARENVYRLCFALGLDAWETGEFFLKAYLERPFNYKNIHEAVYFFCMLNGLGYPEAKRIIQRIEAFSYKYNKDAENVTEQIGYDILQKNTEDDFVNYIVNNRSGFEVQNKTATKKIMELFEECKSLAEEEQKFFSGEDLSVKNIDELLTVITGYFARETADGKKIFKKSISSKESKLPALIKTNFPQREQFKQIEKGTASFDVIRKFLIILKFYHFFADAMLNQVDAFEEGLYDEFIDEANTMLAECGYVQLYWRNPYDWVFGYCAASTNPLDEFRSVIETFYLNISEIYEDKKK